VNFVHVNLVHIDQGVLIMRVIVIGAGPGGLCLARGLRQAGIEVSVHERDAGPAARFQGWRIGLRNEAVDTLRWCLPERLHGLLDATSGDAMGTLGRVVDPQLTELGAQPQQDEGRLFDRNVLRHLLLAGTDVVFDSKLDAYEELPGGGVRARFADGRTETADLLVGADGMGSTVRRQLMPQVQEVDLGVRGVIGRTLITERFEPLVPGWSTFVAGEEIQLFLGTMRFRQEPRAAAAELAPDVELPDTRSYIRWLTLLDADHPLVAGEDPEAAVALLLELTAGWHPDLRALIEQADRNNSGVGPLKHTTDIGDWPAGAVTLLGDAVHPMPPGGLGANLAFRDARLLAGLLTAVDAGERELADAVADYQRQIVAYGAAARKESLAGLEPMVPAARQSATAGG
jgi:2-polyprenyl-6-methoxyphenol hydroxylase-like FAD-dependent oxidoreductase